MKIAVAYDNEMIGEHFGHAECFAIYDFGGFSTEEYSKRLVDCSDKHGHTDMANLMRDEDVAAVICGSMGGEARAMLLSYGIVPVAGYMGPADEAALLLATGQLPIIDGMGGCSGGCGGCGGSCGVEDGEDCGCGCGGHCH